MVWMWSSCIFSTQGDLPLLSLSWELCMTIWAFMTFLICVGKSGSWILRAELFLIELFMVWMWSSCIFSTQGDLPLLSLSWELCMTICIHNTCLTWSLYLSRQFNQAIPGTNPAAKTIHCLYHSCEEVSTFHHVNSVGIYIVSYLVVNWLYASFFPRHIASGKPNEALQSETMDRQWLSRVNLNLGMFSEVNGTSLWRTLTYHMLCVPSLVSVVEQQELSLYLWSPKDTAPP